MKIGKDRSIQYKGFWFPEGARDIDYKTSTERIKALQWVIDNWPRKRSVFQAGGSYGVWPAILGKYFDLVYTFEPENRSFIHLVKNCPEPHIYKIQAALSESNKMVAIKRKSFTGHLVADLGTVPAMSIDSLSPVCCDAILLDTEGYEFYGLKGARATINEFRPLILFEYRPEIYEYHQIKPEWLLKLMDELDYVLVKDIQADKIYFPKEYIQNGAKS